MLACSSHVAIFRASIKDSSDQACTDVQAPGSVAHDQSVPPPPGSADWQYQATGPPHPGYYPHGGYGGYAGHRAYGGYSASAWPNAAAPLHVRQPPQHCTDTGNNRLINFRATVCSLLGAMRARNRLLRIGGGSWHMSLTDMPSMSKRLGKLCCPMQIRPPLLLSRVECIPAVEAESKIDRVPGVPACQFGDVRKLALDSVSPLAM